MKLSIILSCIFLATLVSQINGAVIPTPPHEYTGPPTLSPITPPPTPPNEYMGPPTMGPTTPPPTPKLSTTSTTSITTTTAKPETTITAKPENKPCGSNNLGDYQGGCDESVPVIVMPKGRPIMERVLDWFRCATTSCDAEKTTTTLEH